MRNFVVGLVGLCACAAQAQTFVTGFESPVYTGSAAGTPVTGQDGWTLPSGITGNVYTYTGNALGLPQNPTGGDQFMGGMGTASPNFVRAQHPAPFDATAPWTISYDIAANFLGTVPASQNLGSVSLQPQPAPPTHKAFIALNAWVDVNNPALGWNANYVAYDAAGVQFAQPGLSPGPAWASLPHIIWFRQTTVVDFNTNQITSVSITDLTTNVTTTANPVGWYLAGGINSALPLPTEIRFFAGGTLTGNAMGWDNVSVVPAPSSLALLALGGLVAGRRRR